MSWKRSALRLLVVVVALMTIAGTLGPVGATAADEGPPTPPHRFFGTVTDASGDAVTDATIEVVYDGEVVNSTATDGDGYYDLTVADPDSGASDEQVTIRVADTDASEQYAWESGGSTEHDFPNVQDPTPPPTTTTTPPPTTTTTTTSTTTTDDGGGGAPPGGGGASPGGGGGDDDTTDTTADTSTGTTEQGIQDPTTTETRQSDAPTTDETGTDSTEETDETDTTDETDGETTTEEDDGGFLGVPGFGVSPALVALVAAALLALRRNSIDD